MSAKTARFPNDLQVIHAFGPTMAGKGLMGDILALHIPMVRYIARSMIAAEAAEDAVFAALAATHEEAGTLIPCARINQLVARRLTPPANGERWLWTDGIGRTLEQAEGMNKIFTDGRLSPENVNVLHFATNPEALLRRFNEQRVAPDRSGRRDAKLDTHNRRVREYYETEGALLARYRSFGWRIIRLDATNSAFHKAKHIRQVFRLRKLTERQADEVKSLIKARSAASSQVVVPADFNLVGARLEA